MRLIGSLKTEQEAYAFYSFLLKEGIQSIYEPFTEETSKQKQYRIWIYEEDDLEMASESLEQYRQSPNDPKFQSLDAPTTPAPSPPNYSEISEKG